MRTDAVRALSYASRDPDWTADELLVDAIAKRVEQVAETAKYRFPRSLRDHFPDIDWDDITGMRDRLVHDYDHLDIEVLSDVIERHLPRLIREIDRLLAEA